VKRFSARRFSYVFVIAGCLLAITYSCRKPKEYVESETDEWFSGGAGTVFDETKDAFARMMPGMNSFYEKVHEEGDAAFEATFVSAPAPVHQGLGPVYNANSCFACHINDGRGKLPNPGEMPLSLLLRISVPGTDVHGGPMAVPGFGTQLQQVSNYGIAKEADIDIQYTEVTGAFDDGTPYTLRKPIFTITNPYTAMPSGVLVSPRMAPPVFGLGLLEAIPESRLLELADPEDRDDNGISGKVNYVWDNIQKRKRIGRFGWKSNTVDLMHQVASAYNEDMGITTYVFPAESSKGQPQADSYLDDPELHDSVLQAVVMYVQTLAVPGRRNASDPVVKRGKEMFIQSGCNNCHVMEHRTDVNVRIPVLSNQRIFPYSDLLLHDMGDGLADNRPDFDADGREWRTAPLWGIGLTGKVNGHTNFLHDGRARNLMEAVLWHGGEADQARKSILKLPASDRQALIRFLESL